MANSFLAQDPHERFDIVLADGTPTGRTKARWEVHRDGDWHRAVHVWIAGIGDDGEPFLLLQRRGPDKDTWPNRLDPTVGGHYRAGEGLRESLREVEEELGVQMALADLRPLGLRIAVGERDESGIRDRELQDVFLLRDDRPLTAYRPNAAELAALVRFPLSDLLDFFAGDRDHVTGDALAPGADDLESVTCAIDDFTPTIDRYFYRVAIAAGLVLRGERHVAV